MFVLIISYILCTGVVTYLAKTSKQEFIGVTIINVIFMFLVLSMFFIVKNFGQLMTNIFNFITI